MLVLGAVPVQSPSSDTPVCPRRAVEHPSVPEDPEYVRVRTYESQMVIRPHKTFDEVCPGGWAVRVRGCLSP